MNIQTIIVDLDRTLLRSDKTISPYTADILNRCRQQGIKVMAATARPLRTTLPFTGQVTFDGLVVSNGARIVWDDQVHQYSMPLDSATWLLQALATHTGLPVTLETGDVAYSNLPIQEYETVLSDDMVSVLQQEGAVKILAHLNEADPLTQILEQLPEDLYHTVAHGTLLQVMSRLATKWNGIQTLLSQWGLHAEDAIYFGDDQDDVEPIRTCGLGVAVANAIPSVKEVADAITGSNDEDGVAAYLEQMIYSTF